MVLIVLVIQCCLYRLVVLVHLVGPLGLERLEILDRRVIPVIRLGQMHLWHLGILAARSGLVILADLESQRLLFDQKLPETQVFQHRLAVLVFQVDRSYLVNQERPDHL